MVAIVEPDPPHSPDTSGHNHETNGGDQEHASSQQPLDPLLLSLGKFSDYLHDYLEARKDQLSTSVRKIAIIAVAGILALVIAITVLVESVVLLLSGLAELLSARWSNHPGLGEVFIGGAIILIGGVVAIAIAVLWIRSARKRLVSKYENLHAEQRNRFGRDVSQRP